MRDAGRLLSPAVGSESAGTALKHCIGIGLAEEIEWGRMKARAPRANSKMPRNWAGTEWVLNDSEKFKRPIF
jgi:hypothetical protein